MKVNLEVSEIIWNASYRSFPCLTLYLFIFVNRLTPQLCDEYVSLYEEAQFGNRRFHKDELKNVDAKISAIKEAIEMS